MEHPDQFTEAEVRMILSDLSLDPELRGRLEALLTAHSMAMDIETKEEKPE